MTEEWHFVRHEIGQPIRNTLGAEHFAESEEDWSPGEVLVRECIQNSLDAHHDDEVSVTFQVRPQGAMNAATASAWFGSLWPHLRSEDCKLPNIEVEPPSGGFVVVEDFGTRGLEGDVRMGGLSDTDNRFFNFFRAEGLSGNSRNGTTGGSWGVGKSVFNRCSRINTFLALSRRRSERDAVLIGKALLRHHRTQSGEFQELGQFGVKDQANQFLVLPATSDSVIQRFATDFAIRRSLEGPSTEPGLTVVIPYSSSDITADGIVEIVIREYFHPILAGRLRVRVTGEIKGRDHSVDLNQDNLIERAADQTRSEVAAVLELARWSLGDGPKGAYVIDEPRASEPPALTAELLRPTEPAFGELCQRFGRGEPVAIRIPLRVRAIGQQPERASFTVYLQRAMSGPGYRPVFVRGFIVVPNVRRQTVRNQNLFALVTIDDGPLAVMLRAAEPPSHINWSADTANFRGQYEFGKQTIDFVVGAPKFLAEALSDARTQRDLDVWADFFPSTVAEGERNAEGTSKKGKKRAAGPKDPPMPRPKPFRIAELPGGFSVVRDNPLSTPLPSLLEVHVAYDTSRGNPFKKYHSADFELQKLKRELRDLEEGECTANRLVVRPSSDQFRLEVRGLDVNRDLVVKVRAVDSAAGGDV